MPLSATILKEFVSFRCMCVTCHDVRWCFSAPQRTHHWYLNRSELICQKWSLVQKVRVWYIIPSEIICAQHTNSSRNVRPQTRVLLALTCSCSQVPILLKFVKELEPDWALLSFASERCVSRLSEKHSSTTVFIVHVTGKDSRKAEKCVWCVWPSCLNDFHAVWPTPLNRSLCSFYCISASAVYILRYFCLTYCDFILLESRSCCLLSFVCFVYMCIWFAV